MSVLKVQRQRWRSHLFVLCFIFSQFFIGQTKDCVLRDQCSCTFDDGSGTVDLTSVGTPSGDPLIKDVFSNAPDNFAYSFNPCYGFTEGSCVNAAGCQLDSVNLFYYNIGDSAKVSYSYDGSDVIGTYISDDGARMSIARYKCDPSATTPSYVVDGETATSQYGFTITTSAACPSAAPGPGPLGPVTTSSISAGWILTIILVAVLALYLVAGVVFNVAYKKQSGRDLIPNVQFWASLPGLIKEGFRFTISKVLRRQYQAI